VRNGKSDIQAWSIQKSADLYGIENWGAPYFGINEQGNIKVHPNGPEGPTADLHEIIQSIRERGIELPVLLRFNGILRHRVRSIYEAFNTAIAEQEYQGKFFPAYPVKVNQQRQIVDVLREEGANISMGLEVGSKPELIAVLAVHDDPSALLICNGYKDAEYIRLALLSKKVGRRPVIVVEKYSELATILEESAKIGVRPEIGFRLRLSGKGAGRWEKSGGDRAKFGLTVSEILQGIEELRKREMLDCVRLLHFHLGSQLTSIASLRSALKEAVQVYVQLRRWCNALDFVDIGGGLGVDYDGSKTAFESSMNYTVGEYARDVVWVIYEVCQNAEVPHPNIVTESGRATVAHHAVLIFDVLGIANTFSRPVNPDEILARECHESVHTMAQFLKDLTPKNCQETLHDAMGLRNDTLQQFSLGLVSIEDRALADECYWALLKAICKESKALHYVPEDLERLSALLTDTYFCNLSIFQSLPDSWAIEQIFPIMPAHRLAEEPSVPITIADITCDSDGIIERFADLRDVKEFLPAHPLKNGDPYYFAAFLVGAYQEILGDLHNLFGDTNAVHVEIDETGRVDFPHIVWGDTVDEVLHYVQFDKNDLCNRWRMALEKAVSDGRLSAADSGEIFKQYSRAFDGYTYLGS